MADQRSRRPELQPNSQAEEENADVIAMSIEASLGEVKGVTWAQVAAAIAEWKGAEEAAREVAVTMAAEYDQPEPKFEVLMVPREVLVERSLLALGVKVIVEESAEETVETNEEDLERALCEKAAAAIIAILEQHVSGDKNTLQVLEDRALDIERAIKTAKPSGHLLLGSTIWRCLVEKQPLLDRNVAACDYFLTNFGRHDD